MYAKPNIVNKTDTLIENSEKKFEKTEPIQITRNGATNGEFNYTPPSSSPSGKTRKYSMGRLYSKSPEERLIVSIFFIT